MMRDELQDKNIQLAEEVVFEAMDKAVSLMMCIQFNTDAAL